MRKLFKAVCLCCNEEFEEELPERLPSTCPNCFGEVKIEDEEMGIKENFEISSLDF